MADYEEEFIDSMVAVEVRHGWTTIIVEGPDRLGRMVGYYIAAELEQELSYEDCDNVVIRPIPIQLGMEIRLETEPNVFKCPPGINIEELVRRALVCARKVVDHPTR